MSPKSSGKTEKALKRKYNSPLREQQLAETRERIISAGSELVHSLPSWDWKNLTAKAVGERAGVSERTVHRHFSTERSLRDAVLQRLVEESGVNLENLSLGTFDDIVAGMFSYLASFAVAPELPLDPSQTSMDEIRKDTLLNAVAARAPEWSGQEQQIVAAVLDMLWQPGSQDRFKQAWGHDAELFRRTISWFTSLIKDAIKNNSRP